MKNVKLFFFLLLIFLICSCSAKPAAVKPSETFDPEKAFGKANELYEKKDYAEEELLSSKSRTEIPPGNSLLFPSLRLQTPMRRRTSMSLL